MMATGQPPRSPHRAARPSAYGPEWDVPEALCESNYRLWVRRIMAGIIDGAAKGLLAEMATHHFGQPGKMLRPQFVQQLGRCYGLAPKRSLDWAVACELLHNATLIHDDLQDGDEMRRGAKAVWAKFGAAQAINFGDFLLTLAPKPVLHGPYPDAVKLDLMATLIAMSSAIANGQVAELALADLNETQDLLARYLECSAGKTSALFSGLAQGVALIAGKPAGERQQLAELFTPLGQLFQIQDDILDLYGDKGRGEIGCDIKEGKVSFLIACHLEAFPADLAVIAPILAKPRADTSDGEVASIKALFDRQGTLSLAFTELGHRVSAVETALAALDDEALAALVQKLIAAIFAPISHLYATPKIASPKASPAVAPPKPDLGAKAERLGPSTCCRGG